MMLGMDMMGGGRRLPRNGLLLYLARPNSDEYLVGEDTETGEDTYIWGYVLPDDADIRAATGWVNGTANVFYTATGVPIVALATEIAAAILPANVVFSLVDATMQTGKLAIYTATTAEATLAKARSVLRDESINYLFYGRTAIAYDPQDLTTLYQDSAGTLPVYRPGTGLVDPPVGLMLDKSGGGHHASQNTTTARQTLSGRYNLLTATETLSTQSVTTTATNYTLRFEGPGTITLIGTATGTYSAGTHAITCTAGTLTCTVAGSVTKADLRVKRDGSSLPAYQRVDANTYDTAGFPLFLKRDKVDDVLTCVAPAITGSQGMGSTGGAVLGPVIIPAGEYTPLSESALTGIPEITRYVAIDGTLTASEQAVVERYLSAPSSGVLAKTPVFSFGLTSVASFSFTLRTKADTAPVLIEWGDGTQSTHAGTTDQTASHTYAVSGTYAVKVYGADESVLTRFSAGAGGMSGALVMPSGMLSFSCDGSNTLSGTLSLPPGMKYFICTGSNTLSGYTPSAKASNQQRFIITGLNTMSSTDVDNILIDYAAAGGTWSSSKEITIQGNAANRTSASDAAYASLATKLTTLNVD